MSKKPRSLSEMGNIKKPERKEPEPAVAAPMQPAQESRGRGRPAERVPYVQLSTRIRLDVSQQIDEIAAKNGWTIREVVEQAVMGLHNK